MTADAWSWITRCAHTLIGMRLDDRFAGTDWEFVAEDLHETLHSLPPELVALSFGHMVFVADSRASL